MTRIFGSKNKIKEIPKEPIEVKDDKILFQVFDKSGNFVRDYSVEASGEKAGDMAREFAREINGSLK